MVDSTFNAYPVVFGQMLLEGAQELLGPEDLSGWMKKWSCSGDLSARDLGRLLAALEETYGTMGAQGLAIRIGRASFRCVLQRFGDRVGFRTPEFRLLPSPIRLERGLRRLAALAADELGGEITVTDTGLHWLWRSAGSPIYGERVSGGLACYWTVGVLQEFTSWAGGGRFYQVAETECRGGGAPVCVFQIDKKPLD
jgi:hypothetical protein